MMMFSVSRIAFMSTPIARRWARSDRTNIGRTGRPSAMLLAASGKHLKRRRAEPGAVSP